MVASFIKYPITSLYVLMNCLSRERMILNLLQYWDKHAWANQCRSVQIENLSTLLVTVSKVQKLIWQVVH